LALTTGIVLAALSQWLPSVSHTSTAAAH
jgi:hypothetical protein